MELEKRSGRKRESDLTERLDEVKRENTVLKKTIAALQQNHTVLVA